MWPFKSKNAAKSTNPPTHTFFAFAKINARLMPIPRGERFEDPLHDALQKAGLGEVTGRGAGLSAEREIEFCGVDIELHDLDRAPPLVCDTLTKLGAPKGSQLEFDRAGQKHSLPFGLNEGLAIYLNGTDLPEHIYKECSLDAVLALFTHLLQGRGEVWGNWGGPRETAIYLYGPSAAAMQEALAEVLAKYPLCQGARVVRIA